MTRAVAASPFRAWGPPPPNPWLITGSFLLLVIIMALLYLAMRDIPAGTAYARWTGLGAVGVTIGGILMFGESANVARLIFLGLVLAGVVD